LTTENVIKKIVVIGPESTGKSTLCEQLASHFNTVWCPEYARAYLNENGTDYSYGDLLKIAEGQLILEDALIESVRDNIYFIDTDMYVMKVWCEYVFDKCHQFILDSIADRAYHLYLLCNIDLPWSFDELREYPQEAPRKELFHIYKDILINQSTPWVEISGTYEERLQKAVAAVEMHLLRR
jgi:NadR type nicotinamide-nucleotide adenylyltransferase